MCEGVKNIFDCKCIMELVETLKIFSYPTTNQRDGIRLKSNRKFCINVCRTTM